MRWDSWLRQWGGAGGCRGAEPLPLCRCPGGGQRGLPPSHPAAAPHPLPQGCLCRPASGSVEWKRPPRPPCLPRPGAGGGPGARGDMEVTRR